MPSARKQSIAADEWLSTHFTLHSKIGQGSFGSVYLVKSNYDNKQFAMKKLVGLIEPRNVLTELKVMCEYGGCHENVMGLVASNRVGSDVYLVMKYVSHDRFKDIVDQLTGREILNYMRQLFGALDFLHQKHVAHRDVKPSNILYSRKKRRLKLTDFGLSEMYENDKRARALLDFTADLDTNRKRAADSSPIKKSNCKRVRLSPTAVQNGNSMEKVSQNETHVRSAAVKRLFSPQQPSADNKNVTRLPRRNERHLAAGNGQASRQQVSQSNHCQCHQTGCMRCALCDRRPVQKWDKSGTPGFRAPETILRAALQGVQVDVWAAGVVLLSLLSGRYPLMRPDDDAAALLQLCLLCGMGQVRRVATSLGKQLVISPAPPEVGIDLLKLAAACRRNELDRCQQTKCQSCAEFVKHCDGGRARSVSGCFCGDSQSRQRSLQLWQEQSETQSQNDIEMDRLSDLSSSDRSAVHNLLYGVLTAHPDDRMTAAEVQQMLG